MVERKQKILVLEDNLEVAAEIEEYFKPLYVVDIVHNQRQAKRKLQLPYDCYVFDVTIPGDIMGHEILIEAIKEGQVKVPCIIMTGVADLENLRREYGTIFRAFVDKRKSRWMIELSSIIAECISRDTRGFHMRSQFKRFGLNISEIFVRDGLTVENIIELLEDKDTTERDKRDLFSDLSICLRRRSCGLSERGK